MANFTTALIDAIDAVAVSDQQHSSGEILLVVKAKTAALTTADVNDTIQICDLPPGAVLVPELSFVSCEDPGTALTLDIGHADNVDAYADAIVLAAGGSVTFAGAVGSMPAQCATPARTAARQRVYATVKAQTAITAGTTLNFVVAYTLRG